MGNDHKIYALINPLDSRVFYIGCTKNDVYCRLSSHICEGKISDMSYGMIAKKEQIISSIINSGNKPKLIILRRTSKNLSTLWEHYYYLIYYNAGIELAQYSVIKNPSAEQIEWLLKKGIPKDSMKGNTANQWQIHRVYEENRKSIRKLEKK